jgi:hypothetical protein
MSKAVDTANQVVFSFDLFPEHPTPHLPTLLPQVKIVLVELRRIDHDAALFG